MLLLWVDSGWSSVLLHTSPINKDTLTFSARKNTHEGNILKMEHSHKKIGYKTSRPASCLQHFLKEFYVCAGTAARKRMLTGVIFELRAKGGPFKNQFLNVYYLYLYKATDFLVKVQNKGEHPFHFSSCAPEDHTVAKVNEQPILPGTEEAGQG